MELSHCCQEQKHKGFKVVVSQCHWCGRGQRDIDGNIDDDDDKEEGMKLSVVGVEF